MHWDVLSLTVSRLKEAEKVKQELVEWIGTVLGELPPVLVSTGEVNLCKAMEDGKVFLSLVQAILGNALSPYTRASHGLTSGTQKSAWEVCEDLCKKVCAESVCIGELKKSLYSGNESIFVQAVITQISNLCRDLNAEDSFGVLYLRGGGCATIAGVGATVITFEPLPDPPALPTVKRINGNGNGSGNDSCCDTRKVCAVCGCDASGPGKALGINSSYPTRVPLLYPWSKVICLRCYQRNRKLCIKEGQWKNSSDNSEAPPPQRKVPCTRSRKPRNRQTSRRKSSPLPPSPLSQLSPSAEDSKR